MSYYACRYGPEFGDAPAVLVNEDGYCINQWVSSGMGYARLDIVRGTDIDRESVVWLTPVEFRAKFPMLFDNPVEDGNAEAAV